MPGCILVQLSAGATKSFWSLIQEVTRGLVLLKTCPASDQTDRKLLASCIGQILL